MDKSLKIAALGLVLGIATATHAAQQPLERQVPQRAPMMGQPQMMRQMGDAPMMNDPQMRRQMSEMMQGCRRMMSRMQNMQGMEQPRR